MYKLLIILAFLMVSCVVAARETKKEPFYTSDALDACHEYCVDLFRLSPRNKRTYFCECLSGAKKGEIIVVSKGGAVYK